MVYVSLRFCVTAKPGPTSDFLSKIVWQNTSLNELYNQTSYTR